MKRYRVSISSNGIGDQRGVHTNPLAEKIIYSTVEGGWEPHYVVIYGDVATELEILAHMLNISIERY